MDTHALAERLTLATPCEMRWEDMRGDARVRHCGACRLSVHNLAEMTTLEVEALLQQGGRVCARLYRRPDGTVVTGDCRRIWRQQREEAATLLGTALTATAALSFIVVMGLLTLTLFGDNIRRMFGAATAGALVAMPPPAAGGPSAAASGAGPHH
ncbi:hypothetical protein MYMAC_005163 [Corallococcus macrosporus DSM 14697]|uniref:Uncharacterized protein n=2 Tax=Corallococcus macrosporus TaxID=35 RepID=A0A250K0N6_9BACT|nr:hypothetical protein MYMAC_005163 [Corallococcus macrosporus DSM 14697]